jgi:prevent-host-death family protein
LYKTDKSNRRIPMTRVNASEARNDFATTLNRVAYGKNRVVLHRRGKDLAAIVPMEDLELLQKLEDRLDLEATRAALKEARRKGTIPWAKIKKELGL